MALSDLTFKLYENNTLSTAFGGVLEVKHKTDLSDNPQDYVLYFGSTTSDRQLQATSNPGVDDITITPTKRLAAWTASTAVTLGEVARPVVDNNYRYEIVTAGTTDSTEPTWPTSIGSTVLDGTAVWKCTSATHETTEVKLATSNAGLDGATAGASLVMGNTINSLAGNLVEVHIRVTNAVTTVGDNTAFPDLGFNINDVTESAA